MGFDKFIYGTLIFCLVIFAGIGFVTDLNTNYDSANIDLENSDFSTVYLQSEQLTENLDTTSGQLQGVFGLSEVEDDNTENSMFKSAFSALRNMKDLVGMVRSTINAVAVQLEIPAIFISIITIAIGIMIAYMLVLLIFRIKG